jgi:N-acetylglucosamine-6-phosphate deacetylase
MKFETGFLSGRIAINSALNSDDMNTAFLAGQIFDGHKLDRNKAVLVVDGKIISVVSIDEVPGNFRSRDFKNCLLAPAFVDLQIYGGNGKLFSTELTTEALEATYEYCLNGGCTRFMITMATNSLEKFLSGIEIVRQYWNGGGKGLLGLHLEGPYINPQKKGAHLEQFIKKPNVREVTMLLERGKGIIRMMTVAPESCDEGIFRLLRDAGIIVSAGHSNASYSEGMNGFNWGIPAATHLFNAMSPLQGREPGLVGAIYDHPKVVSSVVSDGIHVDFASIRISKKILGERLFFITDAVAEVLHGEYQHVFRKDRYTLPNGTLSGSALTMMQCVKNGVEKIGIDLPEALRMASYYPSKLVGMDNLGTLAQGSIADFVLIDENLALKQVIVGGE